MNIQNYFPHASIAWFRLYESTLRNEHDRAMTNYKLLIHSYPSFGFKKQILGDLFLFLGEKAKAETAYNESFYSYVDENDIFNAARILLMMKSIALHIDNKYLFILDHLQKQKKQYVLLIEELNSDILA
jgi:hypothetical protein